MQRKELEEAGASMKVITRNFVCDSCGIHFRAHDPATVLNPSKLCSPCLLGKRKAKAGLETANIYKPTLKCSGTCGKTLLPFHARFKFDENLEPTGEHVSTLSDDAVWGDLYPWSWAMVVGMEPGSGPTGSGWGGVHTETFKQRLKEIDGTYILPICKTCYEANEAPYNKQRNIYYEENKKKNG